MEFFMKVINKIKRNQDLKIEFLAEMRILSNLIESIIKYN